MDHQEQAKVNPAKIVSGPNVQANSEAANFWYVCQRMKMPVVDRLDVRQR